MGWNTVSFAGDDPLTEGLESGTDQFYFVHSYYIDPEDQRLALFETDYGGRFRLRDSFWKLLCHTVSP